MLRLLFAVLIFYVVYSLHWPLETGIPAVNATNLLFGAIVIGILARKEQPAMIGESAQLKGALIVFGLSMIAAFLIARASGGGDPMTDVTYLKNALFYPLFYFIGLRARLDLKQTRQLMILVFAVAALAGIQAIRQGFDYGIGNFVETHRASGPFGKTSAMANRAGVYYAMYVPMFAAIALCFRRQKLWRLAGIAGVVMMAMAILFTYSRQSYGIALVGIALVFLRRSFTLSVLLAGAMAVLVGYLPSSVTERVQETKQRGASGGVEVDASTASRWEIWAGASQMWPEHPFGVGLNRFKDTIGRYAPAYDGYDAHNYYVLTMSEGGVFGIGALFWLLYRLLRLAGNLRQRAPPDDAEAQGLTLGFGAFVVCMAMGNLYGSPFSEGAVMGNFWMLCGLLERYVALKQPLAATADAASTAPTTPSMAERFPLAARAAGVRPATAKHDLALRAGSDRS